MKKLLLGAAALVALAGPSFAADLPVKAMAPPVPVDLGDLGKLPANERLSRLGLSVVAGPLTDSATLISP